MSVTHGTYGGYQQHQRRGEVPCSRCRQAANDYKRGYRAASGEARRKDRWWNTTRAAALELLVREYPQRFTEILEEVRRQAGGQP